MMRQAVALSLCGGFLSSSVWSSWALAAEGAVVQAEPRGDSAPAASEPGLDIVVESDGNVGPANEVWSGVSLGWDLRAEGVSLFKHYTIGDEDAWFSGEGVGGAVSLSLHFRPPAALARSSVLRWMEFELGASNATHYVTWKEGEGRRSKTDFVENATSAIVGAHFGSGRWSSTEGSSWSGIVLGLAWMPTYVHFFGGDQFESDGKFNPAGLRFTVDWGRLAPTSKGRLPGLRASITWLPYVGTLPTALAIGLGCVFY
jgi:hypothetical protein